MVTNLAFRTFVTTTFLNHTMMHILPLKLKLARHRAHLSMDDLTARMGNAAVSKMTISKMERGLLKPSERTLQVIAKICNVPVSYFYIDKVLLTPMQFRYEKDTPSKKAKQIEATVIMKLEECFAKERLLNASTLFVNPLQDIVVHTYDDVEDAVQQLRRHLFIGSQPIHSVYEMIQEMGIMIMELDIDSKELLGTSTIINNVQPVIIINTNSCTTTERKRFTALHELAHLILNLQPTSEDDYLNERTDVTLKYPTIERLCHRFAGAMLITESSLIRRLGEHRTTLSLPELISIRNMYGISIAATVHRTHDIAIIPDATYHSLFEDLISKNYMETGWGEYPIMEKADRYTLLEERIMGEMNIDFTTIKM